MNRRTFLASAGATAAVSTAGCAALRFTRSVSLDGGSYPQTHYDAANTSHPGTGGPETTPSVYWIKSGVSPPTLIDDGRIYVDDIVLNAEDGTESKHLEGLQGSGVVRDGVVYGVSGDEETLLAFDGKTGERVWRGDSFPAGNMAPRTVTATEERLFVKLYAGSVDERTVPLVVFDRATGEHLWTGPERDSSSWLVAVDGDTVFNSAYEDGLYALSVEDGSVKWSVDGNWFGMSPTVADGGVFTLSYDGTRGGMHAFDAGDGSKLWERQIDVSGPFAASEDTLYLTTHPEVIEPKRDLSDSRLVALDSETGETRWEQQTPVATPPTLADGTLYVGGRTELRTGMVAAYDASSGEEKWCFTRSESYSGDTRPSPIVVSWPAVVDGYIFANISNKMYAIG